MGAALVGYSTAATDCDDTSTEINPGNAEICDGLDNDCSGAADEGLYCGAGGFSKKEC